MPTAQPDLSSVAAAVTWMNERYFLAPDGGKMFVCEEWRDRDFNRMVLRRFLPADLRERHRHQMLAVGRTMKSIADVWLDAANRRQYDAIVCDPSDDIAETEYNLWRGFNVDGDKLDGDWSLLKEHIRTVVCRGDVALFEYHLNWLARAVQYPQLPAGVALVWKGGQGVGKSMPARQIGKLFGPHFLSLTNPRHITGNFNAHFENAILVLLDEAFGTNDQAAQAAMKVLVTEPTLTIERKYHDAQTIFNRTHIIICSNKDWAVPVDQDDRRYCVVAVSDERRGQSDYFAAIAKQMDDGGREAMYCELAARDISQFDALRDRPETDALLEEKQHSQSDVEHWWEQKLMEERLSKFDEIGDWDDRPLWVSREEIREDYARFLGRTGSHVNRQLGQILPRLVPPGTGLKIENREDGLAWRFPSLRDCRRFWDKRRKQPTRWPLRTREGASWTVI